MLSIPDRIGVLILAAGNSSRMFRPKFLLKFDEKKCFLEKLINDYTTFGFNSIKVVLNEKGFEFTGKKASQFIENEQIILNKFSEKERFFSIKLGCKAFVSKDFIFLHNVDNPFIDLETIQALINSRNDSEYVVPVKEGRGGHPVLISNKLITKIARAKTVDINFKDFLKQFSRREVEVSSDKILININTPNQYKEYFKY